MASSPNLGALCHEIGSANELFVHDNEMEDVDLNNPCRQLSMDGKAMEGEPLSGVYEYADVDDVIINNRDLAATPTIERIVSGCLNELTTVLEEDHEPDSLEEFIKHENECMREESYNSHNALIHNSQAAINERNVKQSAVTPTANALIRIQGNRPDSGSLSDDDDDNCREDLYEEISDVKIHADTEAAFIIDINSHCPIVSDLIVIDDISLGGKMGSVYSAYGRKGEDVIEEEAEFEEEDESSSFSPCSVDSDRHELSIVPDVDDDSDRHPRQQQQRPNGDGGEQPSSIVARSDTTPSTKDELISEKEVNNNVAIDCSDVSRPIDIHKDDADLHRDEPKNERGSEARVSDGNRRQNESCPVVVDKDSTQPIIAQVEHSAGESMRQIELMKDKEVSDDDNTDNQHNNHVEGSERDSAVSVSSRPIDIQNVVPATENDDDGNTNYGRDEARQQIIGKPYASGDDGNSNSECPVNQRSWHQPEQLSQQVAGEVIRQAIKEESLATEITTTNATKAAITNNSSVDDNNKSLANSDGSCKAADGGSEPTLVENFNSVAVTASQFGNSVKRSPHSHHQQQKCHSVNSVESKIALEIRELREREEELRRMREEVQMRQKKMPSACESQSPLPKERNCVSPKLAPDNGNGMAKQATMTATKTATTVNGSHHVNSSQQHNKEQVIEICNGSSDKRDQLQKVTWLHEASEKEIAAAECGQARLKPIKVKTLPPANGAEPFDRGELGGYRFVSKESPVEKDVRLLREREEELRREKERLRLHANGGVQKCESPSSTTANHASNGNGSITNSPTPAATALLNGSANGLKGSSSDLRNGSDQLPEAATATSPVNGNVSPRQTDEHVVDGGCQAVIDEESRVEKEVRLARERKEEVVKRQKERLRLHCEKKVELLRQTPPSAKHLTNNIMNAVNGLNGSPNGIGGYKSVIKESPIERDIRLAREREEELKLQKERLRLHANGNGEKRSSIDSKIADINGKSNGSTTPVNGSSMKGSSNDLRNGSCSASRSETPVNGSVFGDRGSLFKRWESLPSLKQNGHHHLNGAANGLDTQKLLATTRIQQEIEEQTQRELVLRALGSIQTLSQERTDAKVISIFK